MKEQLAKMIVSVIIKMSYGTQLINLALESLITTKETDLKAQFYRASDSNPLSRKAEV